MPAVSGNGLHNRKSRRTKVHVFGNHLPAAFRHPGEFVSAINQLGGARRRIPENT